MTTEAKRDKHAAEYAKTPHLMLLDLAEIAAGNDRLRRMWLGNYFRVADERKRRNRKFARGANAV
ncbi:hypothetical protein BBD42_15330 [Paenibacillus sp. BIHB 4019]|uniref:Uncharacterized protein n=1 Tax=Paenibacillus sp. BIHB 4019 TaxID=1870819 RepID=A0A1B2DIY3_9BACL|nr:hypothetical protein [Paenibacillus sp. BIHB 4019]ANY67684.1 hypothetical protein BBD42_15330 [Paenibacillus sp. BIHB 4019]